MEPQTHRSTLVMLAAILAAFFMVAEFNAPAAQEGKSLNENEVIELLEGGVPSARVAGIVDDRGINFDFTAAIEEKVRDAGGGDEVVAALRRASQRHAEEAKPRMGGLVVKTTPGEAQVYLNDEPQGMTSPEGEIRLPDLQPATYRLRVSMPGYESYEKPLTITAGQEQTVYITLLQKVAPVQPIPNPSPPSPRPTQVPGYEQPVPSEGIPVAGVKITGMRFFEGPHDLVLQPSQRVYRDRFDRSSTRSIYWELELSFPEPARRTDFTVVADWYRPDGSRMTEQTISAYVMPSWRSSLHALGFGWVQPGNWPRGLYRVELRCNNQRLTSGTFEIY